MRAVRVALLVVLTSFIALPACEPGEAGDDGVAVEAGALAPGDLVVEVALGQKVYRSEEPVTATVTITNLSNQPVRFVSWLLPAGELEEDLFVVTRDGKPVAYRGPHMKRAPATLADTVRLEAGASLVREVDLARFYDFTRTGRYAVQVDLPLREDHSRHLASKQGGEAHAYGHDKAAQDSPSVSATSGALSFSRCNADQQATLAAATEAANGMSDGAVTYLAGPASATPRYTTWFGTFSNSGWNTAATHFGAIANAFDTQALTFDCGCKKKNVYAYVYSNQPYTIYLCGVFWKVPVSGKDSQGGTLIHEMSHFNTVSSTDDWAYGQSACQTLATSDPAKALDNADSHEYFAENDPARP